MSIEIYNMLVDLDDNCLSNRNFIFSLQYSHNGLLLTRLIENIENEIEKNVIILSGFKSSHISGIDFLNEQEQYFESCTISFEDCLVEDVLKEINELELVKKLCHTVVINDDNSISLFLDTERSKEEN